MKKEKALELLKRFPDIAPEVNKKMKNKLDQFILFDPKRDQCYCTYCESIMPIPEGVKHRRGLICPVCREGVTAINIKNRFTGGTVENDVRCAVLLSSPEDENLYVRCFELKEFFLQGQLVPEIKITEHQRYVFTEKSAVRYGREPDYAYGSIDGYSFWYRNGLKDEWAVRTRFREPVFSGIASNYFVMNRECIRDTCMRHSAMEQICFDYPMFPMNYLRYYQKNPGVERLVKCDLMEIVRDQFFYCPNYKIDYSQTEPHKMIGVTKDVMQEIRSHHITLGQYKNMKKKFPGMPLGELIECNRIINSDFYHLHEMIRATSENARSILKYLKKQIAANPAINIRYYNDYIRQCIALGYSLEDRTVRFPRDLSAAHARATSALNIVSSENQNKKFEELNPKLFEKRKKLEFSAGDYLVRQPVNAQEIINEGAALSHCVAGYAQRHSGGSLTIMFLRKKSEPDKPYFTIEVSNEYKIVQCHGFANEEEWRGGTPKPQVIEDFEKTYQIHLYQLRDEAEKSCKKLKKGA